MTWIIFSILFVIVFGMFIFFKHSQQINYKLFQKQKYYHIKNQIASGAIGNDISNGKYHSPV